MTTQPATSLAHAVEEARKKFTLIAGAGDQNTTACAMTLLSWVKGAGWSDHIECAHPILNSAIITANDDTNTTETQRWQLVEAGLTGVLDTWWIPSEVIAWGFSIPLVDGEPPASPPSHYERTLQAVNRITAWKTDKQRAHLGGADLRGANLGGANLWGAYLGDAYLGDAYLGGANLRGADLRGANIGDAYLRGAYLRGANLGGADLGGADLGGAHLRGANLGGADLGGANLGDANLRGAHLRGANLGGADLGGANLGDANLGGAHLGGADLRDAYLGGADLGDANLRGAKYSQFTLWPAGFDPKAAGAIKA